MVCVLSEAPVKCESELLHTGVRLGKNWEAAPPFWFCNKMSKPVIYESFIRRRVWKMFKGSQNHKAMSVPQDLSVVPKRRQIIPRVLSSLRDVTVCLVKPWHGEQLQIRQEIAVDGNSAWGKMSCFAVLSLLGLQGSGLKCWRLRNAEECYDMRLQVISSNQGLDNQFLTSILWKIFLD